jgi:hypothetical protein
MAEATAMSGVSTVRTLVTQLGQVVGIEQLELDEEGAAAVEVDDFVIDLQAYEDAEVLLAAIDLGPLPPGSEAAAMRLLLHGNFSWRDTGGGVLALSPDQDRIVLIARFEAELMDGDELEERIDALTVAAADWRQRLAEAAATGPGQATTFIVP